MCDETPPPQSAVLSHQLRPKLSARAVRSQPFKSQRRKMPTTMQLLSRKRQFASGQRRLPFGLRRAEEERTGPSSRTGRPSFHEDAVLRLLAKPAPSPQTTL